MDSGDIVFYCSGNKPCIGKLGYKKDKTKWAIIPISKRNNVVVRDKKFIIPAQHFIRHLDIKQKV